MILQSKSRGRFQLARISIIHNFIQREHGGAMWCSICAFLQHRKRCAKFDNPVNALFHRTFDLERGIFKEALQQISNCIWKLKLPLGSILEPRRLFLLKMNNLENRTFISISTLITESIQCQIWLHCLSWQFNVRFPTLMH